MKGGEGWMGKFLFKPLFLPYFFPQFGEKKKTPQNGGLGEKTIESTKITPPNPTRALFKISPIFLFPFSISPKSTKRALVDSNYQSLVLFFEYLCHIYVCLCWQQLNAITLWLLVTDFTIILEYHCILNIPHKDISFGDFKISLIFSSIPKTDWFFGLKIKSYYQ